MAVLTAAQRRHMPSSEYALPGKKMFPINDKIHQEKALQLVSRAENAGSITPSEAATVRRKAHKSLGQRMADKA